MPSDRCLYVVLQTPLAPFPYTFTFEVIVTKVGFFAKATSVLRFSRRTLRILRNRYFPAGESRYVFLDGRKALRAINISRRVRIVLCDCSISPSVTGDKQPHPAFLEIRYALRAMVRYRICGNPQRGSSKDIP